MPRISNQKGYSVAQFVQDIAPLLPIALPAFRSLGVMTTCAHCGKTIDSVTFVLRSCKDRHDIGEVHVLSICKACAASPAKLSPSSWAHVSDTSGLILQENERAPFTQALRSNAMKMLGQAFGGFIVTTIDTP